ncbi:unnamed protein product [Rhizophagus irregularis]|nr:unnamed protein product [Rhizophagus irregularis]
MSIIRKNFTLKLIVKHNILSILQKKIPENYCAKVIKTADISHRTDSSLGPNDNTRGKFFIHFQYASEDQSEPNTDIRSNHGNIFIFLSTNTIKFRNYFYSRLIFFVMKKKLNEIIHGDLIRYVLRKWMRSQPHYLKLEKTNYNLYTYIYIQLNTLFCLLIAVSKLKTSADRCLLFFGNRQVDDNIKKLNRRSIIQRNRLFKIADYVNP